MITVITGVNGAGKSSIAGVWIRDAGGEYFNPDEVARQLQSQEPKLSQYAANGQAWQMGFDYLLNAIKHDSDYTFETTLGGNTITQSLLDAIEKGVHIRIIYVGLSSAELHIERVQYRVSQGGHDIPEDKIWERYSRSIHNMMTLLPGCVEVLVLDNSSPILNGKPGIKKLFGIKSGKITIVTQDLPAWAKPLATVALKNFHSE
ncbi:hypothetical protein MNBD_GAMMA09-400 [hydrothermal vent metagenome]|uniref:Zeta toxin domain-containing protein n=1 Tax=hydrothermal vent metagenome TaxID=652676 RepID=A0A3B0XHP9_9ZZZZ